MFKLEERTADPQPTHTNDSESKENKSHTHNVSYKSHQSAAQSLNACAQHCLCVCERERLLRNALSAVVVAANRKWIPRDRK